MDIDFRMLDPHSQSDIDAWLHLHGSSFRNSITKPEWNWKYLRNPFQKTEEVPIMLAVSRDSIVGALSFLSMEFTIRSKNRIIRIPAGLFTNGMVDPRFRRQGIFASLISQLMKLCVKGNFEVIYGYTANPISIRSLKDQGWREVDGYASYTLYLNPKQFTAHDMGSPRIPAFIRRVLPERPPFLKNYKGKGIQHRFSWGKAEVYFPDIEKAVDNAHVENRISGIRDRASLEWLFDYPKVEHLCFCRYLEDELQAYIILRAQHGQGLDDKVSSIIEDSFTVHPGALIDPLLLSYTADLLREWKFMKLLTYFIRPGVSGLFPVANGFIRRPDGARFLYKPVSGTHIPPLLWKTIQWNIQLVDGFQLSYLPPDISVHGSKERSGVNGDEI